MNGRTLPLTATPTIVVIGDRVEGGECPRSYRSEADLAADWRAAGPERRPWPGLSPDAPIEVVGGYLERLPLACIAAGLVEQAEVWHHYRGEGSPPFHRAAPHLAYRAFRLTDGDAPFGSDDMMAFLATFGAPHILVILGLGVEPALLDACAASVRIYNSIDAPALRVPFEVSARCDIVLTGAQWQSDEVTARHPGMTTAILPIGPEFAASEMFRPLGTTRDYDLVYVAAAQPYKRHDILFDALDRLPRDVRALCVFGYGEMGDDLRRSAAERGLSVDFVGPPGVPFDEVNRLMNRARFGVVCGRDDGAPAILTEYMLAGLPVLANADLACGRQFILPETGMLATADGFADAIMAMRVNHRLFSPRETVLARWTWPHGIARLVPLIAAAQARKHIDALQYA